ncbi:MAG: hypothetical protein WDO68_18185 [Gammaproteobacteria bacterium]
MRWRENDWGLALPQPFRKNFDMSARPRAEAARDSVILAGHKNTKFSRGCMCSGRFLLREIAVVLFTRLDMAA